MFVFSLLALVAGSFFMNIMLCDHHCINSSSYLGIYRQKV